jgi:hypothetical protein
MVHRSEGSRVSKSAQPAVALGYDDDPDRFRERGARLVKHEPGPGKAE